MSHGTDIQSLNIDTALDNGQSILWILKKKHCLGSTKTRIFLYLDELLQRNYMRLYPWRSRLGNQTLAQFILGYSVRYNDNTIWLNALGPSSCYLTMKQTGIYASQYIFDMTVSQNSSRWNCPCRCSSSSSSLYRCWFQRLRHYANSLSGWSNNVLGNFVSWHILVTHALTQSTNQHWQAQACYNCPLVLMPFQYGTGLIERSASQ